MTVEPGTTVTSLVVPVFSNIYCDDLSSTEFDEQHIRNIHNMGDDRVFSVSPQVGKDSRPFVGIIVILDKRQ